VAWRAHVWKHTLLCRLPPSPFSPTQRPCACVPSLLSRGDGARVRGCRSSARSPLLEHGFHNVSRWMTWLPISLKNAAKCDNWYQLQNHSITESLNAKGAREKLFKSDPRACRIAQCRTTTLPNTRTLCASRVEMKCKRVLPLRCARASVRLREALVCRATKRALLVHAGGACARHIP
jgi:hypothetical protein